MCFYSAFYLVGTGAFKGNQVSRLSMAIGRNLYSDSHIVSLHAYGSTLWFSDAHAFRSALRIVVTGG